MSHSEVAVIGGGPAGSIAGALLAEKGFETTIYDRATFPRKKLCGEFISPGGTRALARLDLLDTLKEKGGTLIEQFSISTRQGLTLHHEFHESGFSLSRKRLDIILLNYARTRGATIRTNTRVTELTSRFSNHSPEHTVQIDTGDQNHTTHTCELMVGAYGRRTTVDRKLHRPFFETRSPFVGFQRHHTLSFSTSFPRRVELYLVPGGYCGLVRIERDRVNVCMMIHRDALPNRSWNWSSLQQDLLSENDALASRLDMLRPAEDSVRSVAQIPLQTKESFREPLLFTGDATGMIAPLTGNGQASAIRSSIALADLIEEHGIPRNQTEFHQLGKRWTNAWNTNFGGQITLGQLLNKLLQYESLANTVVRGLNHAPALTSFLEKYITSRRERTE